MNEKRNTLSRYRISTDIPKKYIHIYFLNIYTYIWNFQKHQNKNYWNLSISSCNELKLNLVQISTWHGQDFSNSRRFADVQTLVIQTLINYPWKIPQS